MPSLFQQIQSGHVWDFHGGIHPPSRKQQTSQRPIGVLNLPERLYVPLRQHIGVAGRLLVKVGDTVLKGQALTSADNAMAVPVHAPTSGTIIDITTHPSAHPSALPEPVIVIAPDGREQWRARHGLDIQHADKNQIIQRIHQAGIAGMGGAGFPSHIKAGAAAAVDYLIINAVECEPYITADDVLMQHHADTIVQGIEILAQLLQPKAVLIGIENDKPAAIAAMKQASQGKPQWFVKAVPVKYPSGGEKQLIQLLTSKEVPSGRRPIDIGIVVQNVGTAFAIAQAVLDDIPLISRIVTVTGESLAAPQNFYTLLGTPVRDLLSASGFAATPNQRLIMGGPMMGFTLPDPHIPVVKTTNCIIAPTETELPQTGPEMDCIRCGACTEACPASLLPQQLLWYSKANDHAQLQAHNLQDCIECGACAFVCPSEIPLVHYYRVAKAEIRETQREALKAEQAKARFEARKERLEAEKQERLERNKQLAAQRQQQLAEQQKQQIAQAQARVAATADARSHDDVVAERERMKAQARAYQAAKQTSVTGGDDVVSDDPRKAAVAAALARAKAKKAQQGDSTSAPSTVENHSAASTVENHSAASTVDSSGHDNSTATTSAHDDANAPAADAKKAAVAAAIARAKAKKAQQADSVDPSTGDLSAVDQRGAAQHAGGSSGYDNSMATTSAHDDANAAAVDAKKAAVAAAIARAKAKKAQQADSVDPSTGDLSAADQRGAAQHAGGSSGQGNTTATTATDDNADAPAADAKKAAIAAAIARAKAKKAQQADSADPSTVELSAADQRGAAQHAGESSGHDNATATTNTPTNNDATASDPAVDAKKAAIAAAIARAKAKKAAQEPKEPS